MGNPPFEVLDDDDDAREPTYLRIVSVDLDIPEYVSADAKDLILKVGTNELHLEMTSKSVELIVIATTMSHSCCDTSLRNG